MKFVIVKNSCNDTWLNNKMFQLTYSSQIQLSDVNYPIVFAETFEDINQYVDDADWLFIQAAGDVIVDRDHMWNRMQELPDDVGIVSHIMWKRWEKNPWLHRQCIILNTAAIKKPLSFNSTKTKGKSFVRSQEDLHGGYAPLWVGLGEEEIEREPFFGTDLIEQVLENGYKVVNFDEDWRYNRNVKLTVPIATRGYLNPEIETEKFARCFRTLTVEEGLDPAQEQVITILNHELKYNILNSLHWDNFDRSYQANLVIAPANGFMAEAMALSSNADSIVFYDVNQNNIDFKKFLYSNWDGVDYERQFRKFAAERGLKIDPEIPTAIMNAGERYSDTINVINNWNAIKKKKIEFICGDIVLIADEILNRFVERTYLHTSTILNGFMWTHVTHDLDKILAVKQKIRSKVQETNSFWFESQKII